MRIISGKYKGRRLINDKSPLCRPTQDRVKEALFSILASRVEGARCLDLCCGSGSLGIEAFSRGASEVVCVDKDIKTVKKNIEKLDLSITVVRSDLCRYLKQSKTIFDLILLDPPYKETLLYEQALNLIKENQLLQEEGLIICEHKKKHHLEIPKGLSVHKTANYGSTSLTFLSN